MMKTLYDLLGKPVLFHVVFFYGKSGPSITGYLSNDSNTIGDQLSAMQNLGGEGCGVIGLTYGPTVSSFIHESAMEMCFQCAERDMPFALCYDPWTVKGATGKTADEAMIAALQHPDTQAMMNSRTYISSINGIAGKLVLDFNTGADASVVQTSIPGLTYWMQSKDYSWPQIPGPTNNNTKLPCLTRQFDDGTGPNRNMSVWNQAAPVRLLPSLSGGYWWGLEASAYTNAEYIQVVTWNDYYEQTQVEDFASMLWGILPAKE